MASFVVRTIPTNIFNVHCAKCGCFQMKSVLIIVLKNASLPPPAFSCPIAGCWHHFSSKLKI